MDENIIKNFTDKDGKIKAFPARRAKFLQIVEYFAGFFQVDKIYSEQEVNEIIAHGLAFDDYVTIRRELIDGGFLVRKPDGSQYKAIKTKP